MYRVNVRRARTKEYMDAAGIVKLVEKEQKKRERKSRRKERKVEPKAKAA
jgi:hypothetical protein